jgi:ATP-dependent DNA helicase RecQ
MGNRSRKRVKFSRAVFAQEKMPDLQQQLQDLFGLDDFRPSQREVIEDVLSGRDVLCVMPTGAGKSLCYQLPAAVGGGLTMVVSPLISLMEDQVQQLRDEGIPALLLNSSLSPAEQRKVIAELNDGFEGLLYIAPERLLSSNFQSMLQHLRPKLLAVDEAHCISQWGHDFRPEYSRLGEARKKLGDPPAIALTATATEDVRIDIIAQLSLREPNVVVTGFDRPGLLYESRRISNVAEKDSMLIGLLKHEPGSAIVYCATRKAVDRLCEVLPRALPKRALIPYHAGLDAASRTANQERFMQTSGAIAVATNAFGMGINKPDTRLVAHYNLTGTLEAYYQEAGRAGRDGRSARCVILFSYQDRFIQEFFIDKLGEENPHADPDLLKKRKDRARQKLDLMVQYATTHRCRRQMILDYFGDEAAVADCACDICRKGQDPALAQGPIVILADEVVTVVRQILSAIARCRGQFGVGVVADVLAGSDNERTQKWNLDKLPTFGLLRSHSSKRIIAMLHRVLESGLARQRDPDGVKFRPVVELTAPGIAVMRGQQPPPAALADLLPTHIERAPATRRIQSIQIDESLNDEAQSIFERLRELRARIAREGGLPAFVVCHDSTLKQLALRKPRDAAALAGVKGMGPYKIKMYGEAFLDALRDEC